VCHVFGRAAGAFRGEWGAGVQMRRLCAALLVSLIVLTQLAGTATGAAPVEFVDAQGSRLTIDAASQTFNYRSPFGRLSGRSETIKSNRRFTFVARGPDITLIASVDMPSQRATATLVDSTTHRWLTSMRNAGTTLPTTPTATPTPALDAWRAVGDGLLAHDSARSFKLDVFKNARQPLRGRFEYHDEARRIHFVSKRVDRLEASGGQARVEGVGTLLGCGESRFDVRVSEVGANGAPAIDVKLTGFDHVVQDDVRAGRVRVNGTASQPATGTATRTPTRLPTYTPTATPTPYPTNTPLPSSTPTRGITI
jgi:hypothetical protein